MSYEKKLKAYKKRTITKEELENLFSLTRDDLLFAAIEPLAEKGLLRPVKASKTNGNIKYPIFLKYKIIVPEVRNRKKSRHCIHACKKLDTCGRNHRNTKSTEHKCRL